MCSSSFLLLVLDERDAGAVTSPAVEHRQCRQRWCNASVSSHVPQLVSVPLNGVVVVQLNSAAKTFYFVGFIVSLLKETTVIRLRLSEHVVIIV